MQRRVSSSCAVASCSSAPLLAAFRHQKVPLGGFSDEWLERFMPRSRSRTSGRSNDPIVDVRQRLEARQAKRKLPKGTTPKGLPTRDSAKTLEAKIKQGNNTEKHQQRENKKSSSSKRVSPGAAVMSDVRAKQLIVSTDAADKRKVVTDEAVGLASWEESEDSIGTRLSAKLAASTTTTMSIACGGAKEEGSTSPCTLADLPVDADGGLTWEGHRKTQEFKAREIRDALVQSDADVDVDASKYELEHAPVAVNSTVGASELDEIEGQFRKSLSVRVSNVPRDLFDRVYDRKERRFGGGADSLKRQGRGVNMIRFHTHTDTNDTMAAGGDGHCAERPAEENPHFPISDSYSKNSGTEEVIYSQPSSTVPATVDGAGKKNEELGAQGAVDAQAAIGGAYYRRPSNNDLVPRTLGTDVWTSGDNSQALQEIVNAYDAVHQADRMAEGPMDCFVPEFHAELTRRAHLKFLSSNPINEMIQEPYCRIHQIEPKDAEMPFKPIRHGIIPTAEARQLAKSFGLDLIRLSTEFSSTAATQVVAACVIGDHREHLRRDVKVRLANTGVNAPPPKPLIDMEFRGATHPFAIRHKVARIIKQLVRGAPARISLTNFGTPHEGFPVFQSILDEVMKQANEIKAFHRASPISSSYDEISCFLIPTTAKSPKSSVTHPSSNELEEAKKKRVLEEQREIHFEGYYGTTTAKERLTYAFKIDGGTAWSDQDEGLSLRDQRRMKVFQGFLPKGNQDLYSRRGDVNVPFPFKTNYITTMDKWNYGKETNLDQAERAAAVLGKRRQMPISEMHDLGETEDNPSTVDKFYYRMRGEALDVGAMKESLGLKSNRKRTPSAAGPWGTLGSPNTEESPHFTVK